MKVEMTSSPYGPYELGYTHVTMVKTICYNLLLKVNHQPFPQFGLETATCFHEGGITSNRGSGCHGEFVPGPCTHRPSHAGSVFYWKVDSLR